jgi:hypothetical protein
MPSLRQRLLKDVVIAPVGQKWLLGDGQWSETYRGDDSPIGKDMIVINDDKFRREGGGPRYREKMITGEALHLLKDKAPRRHKELWDAALKDKEYMKWAKRSYEHEKKHNGEKRSFAKWHRISRFDQVIGGYILAQDPDIPTMRDWRRDDMPIGRNLRTKLEKLRQDLSE